MALIDCPACAKRISNRLQLCPDCGCKIVRLDLDLGGLQYPAAASDYTTMKAVQLLGAAMVLAGPVAWLLGGDALTDAALFTFGLALSLVAWLFSRYSEP